MGPLVAVLVRVGGRLVVRYVAPTALAGVRVGAGAAKIAGKGLVRGVPAAGRGLVRAAPYVASAAAVGAGAASAAANLAAAGINATAAGAHSLAALLPQLSDQPLLAQPLYEPILYESGEPASAVLPAQFTPEEWTWLLTRLSRVGPSVALVANALERDWASKSSDCSRSQTRISFELLDEDSLEEFFRDASWPEREEFLGKLFKTIGGFAKKILPVVGSQIPFVGGIIEAVTQPKVETQVVQQPVPAQAVTAGTPLSVSVATQALTAALLSARASGATPQEGMQQLLTLVRTFIPADTMRTFVLSVDPSTAVFYRLLGLGFTGQTFEGLVKLSGRYPKEVAQIVAILARFGSSESDAVPSLERSDSLARDAACDCDICKHDAAQMHRTDSVWNHSIRGQGEFYRSNMVTAHIDPRMPQGLHGEISFKDWPFRIRVNANQADGRALVSLMHEMGHMFDRMLKLGLSHDQVHGLGILMATEALPAGIAYKQLQLGN